MTYSILLQLEEGSVFRHAGERKVRTIEEDEESVADSIATDVTTETEVTIESNTDDDSSDSEEEKDEEDGKKEMNVNEEVETEETNDVDNDNGDSSDEDETIDDDIEIDGIDDACEVKMEKDDLIAEGDSANLKSGEDKKGNDDVGDTKVEKKPAVIEFPDTEITLQHVKGDK